MTPTWSEWLLLATAQMLVVLPSVRHVSLVFDSVMLAAILYLLSTAITFLLLTKGGRHVLYLARHTLLRDITGALRFARLLWVIYYKSYFDVTVPSSFSTTVKRFGDKSAIIFGEHKWSFNELNEYSNRVANLMLQKEYKEATCVALFMENRPEYIGTWLGLVKVGLVPALVNTNLKGKALRHSIECVDAKAVIYGAELASVMQEMLTAESNNNAGKDEAFQALQLYYSGSFSNGTHPLPNSLNLDALVEKASSKEISKEVAKKRTSFKDKLLYIYTSGTTGLPKAAVIKHSRFYYYSVGMNFLHNLGSIKDHVLYDPLPLYHSVGGIVGVGIMMFFGTTIVIRRKFSVRNFWKDCVEHKCTSAQYIGEICRYLLSAPQTVEEKRHQLKIMIGNGLRPHIWKQFQNRFNIPKIGEFYGATEGNSSLVNTEGHVGAVGFQSVLFPFVYPVRLLKITDDGDLVRDNKTGLCITCGPDEPGEFVGKIVHGNPARNFDGYVDKAASSKKIAYDVIRKGDKWFRSGDILVADEFGWTYFVDRMGDTFRWKGENVSTTEVEAVVAGAVTHREAIVYGVQVPFHEGRAGMVAIVRGDEDPDLAHLYDVMSKELPSYALPLFVRLVDKLDVTGTFKIRKVALQKEGFDLSQVSDPIYVLDTEKRCYTKLDESTYADIVDGRRRF